MADDVHVPEAPRPVVVPADNLVVGQFAATRVVGPLVQFHRRPIGGVRVIQGRHLRGCLQSV